MSLTPRWLHYPPASSGRIDRGFPVFNIRTLADRVRDSLSRDRMVAQFSAALGGVALLMATVGVYGLLAYSVTRRTREIGIRMALGALGSGVVWLVVRDGLRPVAWGVIAAAALLPAAPRAGVVAYSIALAAMAAAAAVAMIFPNWQTHGTQNKTGSGTVRACHRQIYAL